MSAPRAPGEAAAVARRARTASSTAGSPRRGELAFQRCAACGRLRHPPRFRCARCGSTDDELRAVARTRPRLHLDGDAPGAAPAFARETPYAVVVTELEEGVRIVTGIREMTPDDAVVSISRSRWCWSACRDEVVLPYVRPRRRRATMPMDLSRIGREIGPIRDLLDARTSACSTRSASARHDELAFATENSEGVAPARAADVRHHRRHGRRRGSGRRALVRQLRRAPGRAHASAGRGVRRARAAGARARPDAGRRHLRQARRARRSSSSPTARDAGDRRAHVPELQLAVRARRRRLRRRPPARVLPGRPPRRRASRTHTIVRGHAAPSRRSSTALVGRPRAASTAIRRSRAAPASSARSCTDCARFGFAGRALLHAVVRRRPRALPEHGGRASRSPPTRATSCRPRSGSTARWRSSRCAASAASSDRARRVHVRQVQELARVRFSYAESMCDPSQYAAARARGRGGGLGLVRGAGQPLLPGDLRQQVPVHTRRAAASSSRTSRSSSRSR